MTKVSGAHQHAAAATARRPEAKMSRHPIRRTAAALLLALPGGTLSAADSTLLWTCGDKLSGEWLGLQDGWLEWKSPLLGEPVRLWLPRLHGWDASGQNAGRAAMDGAWLARLNDHSVFSADDSISFNDTWTLVNRHAGTMSIAPAALIDLQRRQPAGPLLYSGPCGEPAWIHENPGDAAGQNWAVSPGGALRTRSIDQAVSLPLALPERTRLDLWLRTAAKDRAPQFKLRIRRAGQGIDLETWLEELVGRGEGMPARLATLYQSHLMVTLCIDFKQRQARAYDQEGRELIAWKIRGTLQSATADKRGEGGGLFGALADAVLQGLAHREKIHSGRQRGEIDEIENGLTLINTGADLALERLLIRAWNGQPPAPRPAAMNFVELLDASLLTGAVVSIADGEVKLEGGKATRLDAVAWISRQSLPALSEDRFTPGLAAARARYHDSSIFHGRLLAADTETFTCQPVWSPQPVGFKRKGLQSLRWHEPEPLAGPLTHSHAHLDTLEFSAKTPPWRGHWEPSAGARPHWRFDGGERAVPVLLNDHWSLHRPLPDADAPAETLPTLACLDTGETIPVEIQQWHPTNARLRAPWSVEPARALPPDRVRALELPSPGLQNHGFTDRGWMQLQSGESPIQFSDSGRSVLLPSGASLGHGSFLQGTQLSFQLAGDAYASLRLRLFTEGVREKSPHLAILVSRSGSNAYCGVENPQRPGQLTGSYHRIPVDYNKPCAVTLKWNTKQLEFHASGMLAFRQNLTEKVVSGTGLILEPAGMWGNESRSCTVSNLVLRSFPGARARPTLDPDSRQWALSIPRRLSETPPLHLLLAPTGDLLRGTLEALGPRQLRLRSGLDFLEIPRERAATLVLPRRIGAPPTSEPAPAKPDDSGTSALWITTQEGGLLRLHTTSLGPRWMEGRSSLLGDCRLPVDSVISISTLAPANGISPYRNWAFEPVPEPDPSSPTDAARLTGQKAPDFKLPLVSGGQFHLQQARGKIVVLDFWASWCGPCLSSLPEVIEAMRELPAERVQLLGINQGQPREEVAAFLQARDWTLPCALDLDRKVSESFGANAIPHTVLIAPDGTIARVQTGYTATSTAELVSAVRELLGD